MKFNRYLLFFLCAILAFVSACSDSNPDGVVGTALDTKTDPAKVDTTKYNSEYLLYSTVKINGVLPLESKYADFVKVIGKPDSVVKFDEENDCQSFAEPHQYIYFQGSMFYLVKDKAIFQNIDFRKRPDLEIESVAITLNGKTTLQDIQKLFPRAVSNIRTMNSPRGSNMRFVAIGASKEIADEWWNLTFDGDKLVNVEMYSPC
jgi:hypothetical protein